MRRAALTLLLALTWPCALAAQAPAPELPRAVPSTVLPAVTRTVLVTTTDGLLAALDSAKAGDAIELPCTEPRVRLVQNFVASHANAVLRAACWAMIPPGRMTPNVAGLFRLPILASPNNQPALEVAKGANYFGVVGIEFTTGHAGQTTALIALGLDVQTALADIPHGLVLDRLYMHGSTTGGTLRRAVALNSAMTAVVNSWCAEVNEPGSDSQCLLGYTGPGPYLILNNHLEAASEIIMFGGGDPLIRGLVPCDITIQKNHLTRPLAWVGTVGVKNLFELKNACRVLVEGNVMERNWSGAQDGTAIVLKSTNQYGSCTWCTTKHVTVRLNIVRYTGAGFNIAAHPEESPVEEAHDFLIEHNLLQQIRVGPYTGTGRVLFAQNNNLANVTFRHNTSVSDSGFVGSLYLGSGDAKLPGFTYTDNVVATPTNLGIYGDNSGPGDIALNQYAPGSRVTGNVFAGMDRDDPASYQTMYPAGNFFVKTLGDVGFTGTFALAASSPFKGKASDGTDPGADMTRLLAATAGVVDGDPVTPPTPVPMPVPTPTPTPTPLPTITVTQLRAAITALDKVISPSGRESKATKAALAPVAVYLHALLGATP